VPMAAMEAANRCSDQGDRWVMAGAALVRRFKALRT